MFQTRHLFVALPVLLAACPEEATKDDTDTTSTDAVDDTDTTAPDTDTTPADDTPTDEGSDDDSPADTDVPVDTDIPEEEIVRFVALGDAGEGNTDQYAVAEAMKTVCDEKGCEFALYLGDNFYESGVQSVSDGQFESKFELPYADIDFPFYVVLGNHDFGEIPLDFGRTDYQVQYSLYSDKWTMPDHFYSFEAGPAYFIGLDTNMIMLGLNWTGPQKPWLRAQMAAGAAKTWRVAYGHHPWKSNGEHGNAGNYEGAFYDVTGIIRGDNVRDTFRDVFCNELDFYICGHDHNRQWLEPVCGVNLIVSGAGAKLTEFVNRDNNKTIWDDDTTEGFTWIELKGRTATIAFYDKDANLQYEGTITK